jgi:tRNA pseudouridine55 synthase
VVLKKRKVTVLSLDIVSVDLPNVDMVVRCSRGTYIRSLVTRLGSELGPGAHLQTLRRLSCGSFCLKDALNLSKIRSTDASRVLQNSIVPLREALPHMKETKVSEGMAQKIRQGHQPRWTDLFRESGGGAPRDDYVRVVKGKELVAILRAHYSQEPEGGWLKVRRVFH